MIDRRDGGFTLIEVLVALAIIGLAFGFALPAISMCLDRSASTAREDQATDLAENLLARVGRDIPLVDGNADGKADGLAWDLTITPRSNEGDAAQHAGVTLHRVAVTVTWMSSRRQRSERLVTLRLVPAP